MKKFITVLSLSMFVVMSLNIGVASATTSVRNHATKVRPQHKILSVNNTPPTTNTPRNLNSVPVTLVVTSNLDDGDGTCTVSYCTFRDAVANAVDGDTVEFGSVTGSIILTQSNVIDVAYNISILGPGKDILSVDFNQDSSNYIAVHDNGHITMSGLTLWNDGSTNLLFGSDSTSIPNNISNVAFTYNLLSTPVYIGGGDWNFTDVTFSGNDFCDWIGTGAIFSEGAGRLTITGSTFSDNYNCGSDYGGQVYMDGSSGGTLAISGSVFSNNDVDGSSGGAVEVDYVEDATITNSTFDSNANVMSVVLNYSSSLTITNSTFTNNESASNGSGGVENIDGTTHLINDTFQNNSSESGINGAIANDSGELTVVNTIVSGVDNCIGGITSLGHNIDTEGSCDFTGTGDLSNEIAFIKKSTFVHTNGGAPWGSLMELNGKFYGLTSVSSNYGVLFEYNPANIGSELSVLHDFSGSDGSYPYGSLVAYNSVLYGVTNMGGANGFGTIFSYDPANVGSEFTKLHDFDNTNGRYPSDSLVLSGGKLYGVTGQGGANDYGTIFSYDPASIGTEFTKLHDFDDTHGRYPNGALIVSNSKLYGMTSAGGANSAGTIFSYDPASVGTEFSLVYSFDSATGGGPNGSLVVMNNKFYGMAYSGGANNYGVIFSYDPANVGSEYSDLHDFNVTDGSYPNSSLVVHNSKLYGMTPNGGTNNAGVIVEYNPANAGSEFSVVHNFGGLNGTHPYGSFMESGGVFYGMTSAGGAIDDGVIFKFNPDVTPFVDFLNPAGLQDNGGDVPTVALISDGVAIDAASDDSAPATDARGILRPQGLHADIGAYEYEAVVVPPVRHHSSGGSSAGVIAAFKERQDQLALAESNTPSVVPPVSNPVTPAACVITTTLKSGMVNEQVKCLQQYLNNHNFPVSLTGAGSLGNETILFGKKTKSAVILFQKSKGLTPDGVVGPKTRGEMK